MSGLVIREPVEADREAWQVLWTAYLAFYESSVDEAVYDNTWRRFFTDGTYEPDCLLAERDGKLIGLVHFMQHRHNWRVENVIYLQDLYVSEEARGTGAGRALIEAVYAYGDDVGCPTVYWNTQHFNETARKLYDRVATLTPFIKYQR